MSLSAGVVGGFCEGFLVGFFCAVLFHDLFLGRVAEDGATAVPGVLFDFVAPPPSFFAFFRWGMEGSPDFVVVRLRAFFVSPSYSSNY